MPLVGSCLCGAGVRLLPGLSPSLGCPLPQLCCAAGPRGVPAHGGAGTRRVVAALLCLGPGQFSGGLGRVLLTVLPISPRSPWPWQVPALLCGWALGSVPVGGCGGQERLEPPRAPSPTPLPPREFDPLRMGLTAPPSLPLPLHPTTEAAWPPRWPCLLPLLMDLHHRNSSCGSLGSPTAAPSPRQRHGQCKAPLSVPKGWSRDPQPGTLWGCGGQSPGRRRRRS